MYFDEGRSFHGTYWHDHFGFKRSHGCVNLSPRDSAWLYEWADEGTHVYVHDPSGVTPTDPEFYGFEAAP
jgi:lipoprotein-anchoring transpeptidase ErfK/SrfK